MILTNYKRELINSSCNQWAGVETQRGAKRNFAVFWKICPVSIVLGCWFTAGDKWARLFIFCSLTIPGISQTLWHWWINTPLPWSILCWSCFPGICLRMHWMRAMAAYQMCCGIYERGSCRNSGYAIYTLYRISKGTLDLCLLTYTSYLRTG
jgi:hypothetical protein